MPRFRIGRLARVLLAVYGLLLLASFGVPLAAAVFGSGTVADAAWGFGWVLLLVGLQAVFVLGAGTRDLLKPIHRKRRLLAPVIVAGLMMALLVAGLYAAVSELAGMENDLIAHLVPLTFLGSWLVSGACSSCWRPFRRTSSSRSDRGVSWACTPRWESRPGPA